jgi:hypothetical protein
MLLRLLRLGFGAKMWFSWLPKDNSSNHHKTVLALWFMRMEINQEWFEDITIVGQELSHVSKFWRRDLAAPLEFLGTQWPSWTIQEKVTFAAAFSAPFGIFHNSAQWNNAGEPFTS